MDPLGGLSEFPYADLPVPRRVDSLTWALPSWTLHTAYGPSLRGASFPIRFPMWTHLRGPYTRPILRGALTWTLLRGLS